MDFTDLQIASTYRRIMLEEFGDEHEATLRVLRACPEDKIHFSPHEKAMTFSAMALHIYNAGQFFANRVDGQDSMRIEEATSREDMIGDCDSMQKNFIERFQNMTDEQLTSEVDFMGKLPAIILLSWHMKHLIHHRGQLQTYLRLMGATCPSVYGPTADS